VGRTDFCDYPEEAKNIESIGNIDQPNVEKIVELQPDVVIASSIFTKEMLQKLEEANIKVAIFQAEKDFEGVYNMIEKIGLLLNAREEAKNVVTEMKEKIEFVKSKVDGLEKPSVYYVLGYGEFGIIPQEGHIYQPHDWDGWRKERGG